MPDHGFHSTKSPVCLGVAKDAVYAWIASKDQRLHHVRRPCRSRLPELEASAKLVDGDDDNNKGAK